MKHTGKRPVNIYYCGEEKCKPEHFFGPAIRPHYLMHFILNGRGIYQVGNKVYQVKKGEAFLILPNEITYYQADQEEPWEYAWTAFDGNEAEKMLKLAGLRQENLVCKIHNLKECRNYLVKMIDCYQNSGFHEYEMIGFFYLLFSTVAFTETSGRMEPEEGYLNKALTFIRENYSYNINVTDIARYVGIDRTYLFKIFKKYENSSVKNYLIHYRMTAAKNMIKSTGYNMTEIALSCGFNDLPSFCRLFKQKEGITPTSYREHSYQIELTHKEPL